MHDGRDQACRADEQRNNPIQDGVAYARAARFVRQVPEVKSCRKGTAKSSCGERRHSVDQQRWTRRVVVACHLDALENLQRDDRVQNTHRQDNREILPALALTKEIENIDRMRQINAEMAERWSGRQMIEMKGFQQADQSETGQDAQHSAGHSPGQANLTAIHRQNDHRRQQGEFWGLKDSQDEPQTQESYGDTCQRTQQCRPRSVTPKPVGAEGSSGLHYTAHKAGEYPHMPGELRIVRALVNRQHDEEHIREDRGSINSERNRSHIRAVRSFGQSVCLPRIENVAA